MRRVLRVVRFFDWRFLLCFGLAALSLALLLAVVTVAQENAVNGARLDRALAQNDALIAQGKADDAVIRQWQAESRESQDQLRALLIYIRAHGYYIPASLIPAEASGSDTIRAESDDERSRRQSRSSGGSDPKAQGTTGLDSDSTGGSGGSSGGSSDSGSPVKSDDHKPAKPEKDHGGGSDPKPDKGSDKPAKGGKK